MKGFVLVSDEELYSVSGRGGSSSSSSSSSSKSSSSSSSSSTPPTSTYITAPYNAKGGVEVTSYTPGQGGTTYMVTGTTKAEANKAKPTYGGEPYTPVPVPKGTYDVTNTAKPNVGGYGPGYNIQATVPTQLDNKTVVGMSDNYVHATQYNNTYGCLGIITADDKNHGGSKTAFTQVSNTIANSDTVKLTIR